MTGPVAGRAEPGVEGLPVHLTSLLVRIRLWWPWLLVLAITAVAIGVTTGLTRGKRTYEAATVLLYRPATLADSLRGELPLTTQMNLVKIRANLEETRRQLSLPVTLDVLGRSVDVRIQRDTDLLTIVGRWTDADTATAIANTIRDAFLANQARIRVREATIRLDYQIERADEEQRRLDTQVKSLDSIMSALSSQADRQQHEEAAVASLSELNIRAQRTRDAIIDDRAQRMNEAKLVRLEGELAKAEQLLERGLVSRMTFERLRGEYDAQKAITLDTPQVREWRDQLQELHDQVIPSNVTETPASWVLQQVMVKAAELEFDHVGASERVRQLRKDQTTLNQRGAALDGPADDPALLLATIRDSDLTDFRVISEARVPSFAVSSNRRLLAAGAAGGLFGLGVVTIVGTAALSRRPRSGGELALRTGLTVLGALPTSDRTGPAGPAGPGANPEEQVRLLARRVRGARPHDGARVLVTSVTAGEGVTTVVTNLASCIARQGERVLVIDCGVGPKENRDPATGLDRSWRWLGGRPAGSGGPSCATDLLAAEETPPVQTLGQALLADTPDIDDLVRPTRLKNVDSISRGAGLDTPDLLASRGMRSLLESASERYDFVLLDTPPTSERVDAVLLSEHVDGTLLVVASRAATAASVSTARSNLQAGSPVIGTVLNHVEPAFRHCM